MRAIALAIFAVGLLGCPSTSNKCVPGKVESCPCANGFQGTQLCASDGTFGTCQCSLGVGGGVGTGGGIGTGGGVGTGGGIGTGGGGIGMVHQEVLSGTRLKALHLTGDDGSDLSSVNAFWDSQLMLTCVPGFAYNALFSATIPPARCYPSFYLAESGGCFTDALCQSPCGYQAAAGFQTSSDATYLYQLYSDYFATADGGNLGLYQYVGLTDGGWLQVSGLTSSTSSDYYHGPDGGCFLDSSAASYINASSSTWVPPTTFVGFSARHE